MIILLIFIIAYGIALQAVSFPGPGKFAKSFQQVLRGIVDLPYWQMYGELFIEEISGEKDLKLLFIFIMLVTVTLFSSANTAQFVLKTSHTIKRQIS